MSGKLFNRYEVLERLGQGAQSTVYLVRDELNQGVLKAAKILKPDYLKAHSSSALIHEYHLLESIDHENLVRVYECRFNPRDKAPVVITEYIEGAQSLELFLNGKVRPLSFAEKLQVTYQILKSIRYLHRKKIIHGDLKPSNILLRLNEDGLAEVKLIDFGVSLDLIASQAKKRVGTPYYIAPEAVREGVELASDLYSLGVILYRLFVSASLPYHGRPVDDIFASHFMNESLFTDEHFQANNLSPLIRELIQNLLALDPRERPRDLAAVSSQLRFEYPEFLSQLSPPTSGDVRLREVIGGMKASLEVAKEIITKSQPLRPILFVGAPSGGGKSRYLYEVARICQNKQLEHLDISYHRHDFWDHLIQEVMRQYSGAQETKLMGERLRQVMAARDLAPRKQIFSRYLHRLAQELHGLVLMIDGLGQKLPGSFVDILSVIARSGKRNRLQKNHDSPLVLILTVNLHDGISGELSLDEGMLGDEKERKKWRNFPASVRGLGGEGLAHLLSLEPWQTPQVAYFLRAVFPAQDFSEEFVESLEQKTRGNPGLLQALCNEALQSDKVPEKLSALSSTAFTHDLQVYHLSRYRDEEKSVLALLAALETVSREELERIWCSRLQEAKSLVLVKQTLIRAFDDGLIQFEGEASETYTIPNQNLFRALQEISKNPIHRVSEILYSILLKGEETLTLRQVLALSAFLEECAPWAKSLLRLFAESKTTQEKLSLRAYYESLRKKQSVFDWQTRLGLRMMDLELSYLQQDYDAVEEAADEILRELEDMNDPFSNSMRARAQLLLGSVLRVLNSFSSAIQHFKEVVDADLLDDIDHYYALGSMAICQLYTARSQEVKDEAFEYLTEARSVLREADSIRYAALTNNLAGYFMDKREYGRALPYLEISVGIFAKNGEVARELAGRRLMGKCYHLLERNYAALDLFQRTLADAERHGLENEAVDIMIFIVRTLYMLGDFRRISFVFSQLLNLCERTGNLGPIEQVIQPVIEALLETDKVHEALSLLTRYREELEQRKVYQGTFAGAFCDGLFAKIYQRTGDSEKLKQHYEAARSSIVNLVMHGSEAGRQLFQALQLDGIELFEREVGLESTLVQMNELIEKARFRGVFEHFAFYLALHLGIWANDEETLHRYLVWSQQNISRVQPQIRMRFYADLGKYHLDRNDPDKAKRFLREGARLLSAVHNSLVRALLLDQRARLAKIDGNTGQAQGFWKAAEREYEKYLKPMSPEAREQFKQNAKEWYEHRIVCVMLESASK